MWHWPEMNERQGSHQPGWFPFSATEVQVFLGVAAFITGLGAYAGMDPKLLAWGSIGSVVMSYLAGLLAHGQSVAADLQFIRDGGVRGDGYREPFRKATTSLLVMHVDDDTPGRELRALYEDLLDRGVQIRRLLFLHPEQEPEVYDWVTEACLHQNLQQRALVCVHANTMPFSFAIVDETIVLIAVPGFDVTDTEPYAERMIFRHLLVIKRSEITRAFLEIYDRLWRQARLVSADDLRLLVSALRSS